MKDWMLFHLFVGLYPTVLFFSWILNKVLGWNAPFVILMIGSALFSVGMITWVNSLMYLMKNSDDFIELIQFLKRRIKL